MNEQKISELLGVADAGAVVPGDPAIDLADQAIRRANRRSTLRRAGLAVLAVDAVAAVIVVALLLAPGTSTDPLDSTSSPVASITQDSNITPDYDQELADLREKVSMQEAVIEALLLAEQRTNAPIIHASHPLDEVSMQVDLAAKQMVLAADRIERDRGRNDLSRRLYADVVSTFPGSVWADIARRRTDELKPITEPRSAL